MLPAQFITGREIEYQLGTRQGKFITWWSRSPYILTVFYSKLCTFGSNKNLRIGSNRDAVTCKPDSCLTQILG